MDTLTEDKLNKVREALLKDAGAWIKLIRLSLNVLQADDITIEFFRQGTDGGQVYEGKRVVRLNLVLAAENYEEFRKSTLPHELCHLAAFELMPDCDPHGDLWKYCMCKLGVRPDRQHHYNTASVRKTKVDVRGFIPSFEED